MDIPSGVSGWCAVPSTEPRRIASTLTFTNKNYAVLVIKLLRSGDRQMEDEILAPQLLV